MGLKELLTQPLGDTNKNGGDKPPGFTDGFNHVLQEKKVEAGIKFGNVAINALTRPLSTQQPTEQPREKDPSLASRALKAVGVIAVASAKELYNSRKAKRARNLNGSTSLSFPKEEIIEG